MHHLMIILGMIGAAIGVGLLALVAVVIVFLSNPDNYR